MGFLLFVIAWVLLPFLTIINYFLVKEKGYFKSTALNLDIWANREFRTLWNRTLRKGKGCYQFGKQGETISSALGKNERDGTLTKTGKALCWILNNLDENHCLNSINLNIN